MNARNFVLAALLGLLGATACFAAGANMGTWKLNEAKSTIPAGMAKNHTVVYAPAGDSIKVTVDGTTADGKPLHNEWTGKFDGKDYPVTGDATQDARAYRVVDDHTTEIDVKKGGKMLGSGRIVVAADGKSRTITMKGTDSAGKPYTSVGVYDKQ